MSSGDAVVVVVVPGFRSCLLKPPLAASTTIVAYNSTNDVLYSIILAFQRLLLCLLYFYQKIHLIHFQRILTATYIPITTCYTIAHSRVIHLNISCLVCTDRTCYTGARARNAAKARLGLPAKSATSRLFNPSMYAQAGSRR